MSRVVKVSALGQRPLVNQGFSSREDMVVHAARQWLERLDQVMPDRPDLIVLPEYCDIYECETGDSLKEYLRVRGDRVLGILSGYAAEHRCAIAYSSVMESGGQYYNAIRMIDKDGGIAGTYCKNHPVICEMEANDISCGTEAPLIRMSFGSVSCMICFDLNFEDLLERYRRNRPDILIFSSMYHGGIMQQYWAYACQSHFIGACTGLPCTVLSPLGEVIASSSIHVQAVTANINLDCRVIHIDENMERLRAAKRKYGSGIDISVPGLCNLLLLTNLMDDMTADEILSEFDLETWDHYYYRSMERHMSSKELV